ncbi:hypothetical protein M3J09_013501 [Ascochyta lentis]
MQDDASQLRIVTRYAMAGYWWCCTRGVPERMENTRCPTEAH